MTTSNHYEEETEFDPRLLHRMRQAARLIAAIVVAVAVMVLLGWALNVEQLRSVFRGLTAMNPGGTAVAFLLAGGSLWCQTNSNPDNRWARTARILAGVVVILALVRLILYTFGLEWGPDQWLFRAKLDLYQPPNRTAPNTALGLLLVGIGLLMLDWETKRGHRPAEWLAFAAALVALFAVVGYVYQSTGFMGIPDYIPMALNSAALLGLVAIGLLLARPDCGVMAVISHSETGGVMARRLLPASILAPAAFAWLSSIGQQTGLFGPSIGNSLFVVLTTVLFTALIWSNASSLSRIDVDRSRARKELKRKGEILQSVLNSMGDGVVVADRDGRFLIFNPVAERILGLGATDTTPEQWASEYGLFSVETGNPLTQDEIPLVRAIRGESTDQVELLIKSPRLPNGVNISVTGRPLKGDEGIEGGVVVFQDTTQRRRAAEAIRKARDDADAANRAKSEFLANMSHEIRTPMNAVIGMNELVLDTELTAVQRTYLNIAKDSAESLLSLINDVLDFSKIEAGKLELDQTSFQLRDVLGDAMKTLSIRARGKDLELACHVAPEVPDFLIGDPHRLRQIVTNLVGNALKFTEHGEVVVDVSLDEIRDDQVRIHVQVRDTGIGIPQDKLHLLFSAFSQVDASTTRRYGGTGLGLAITARLVQLMNGRTWVESEPGTGSAFHFTATFEKDTAQPPTPLAPEALKNLRVLVVDDNATNRLILREHLLGWNMRPVCVDSALAALDALESAAGENDPFQIVLSDVQMPDVDGFELTSRIRRDARFGSTVIMMLSSGAGPGDISRCRELGVVTHLMKPIKSSELLKAIAAALGAGDLAEPPRDRGARSERVLNILLAEDSDANQRVAMGVLGKWGHSLTIVSNGLEAVAAFERGTYDVILMDVQMPVMDGFQAAAEIRARESVCGGHVPIVALTAHAMKGDREECMKSGMDDYVTKPIRWPELRLLLERIVPASTRPGTTNAEPELDLLKSDGPLMGSSPADPDIALPEALHSTGWSSNAEDWSLDWNEAMNAVNNDQSLFREIMGELLNEWPKLLESIDRAAADVDLDTLKRASHTIRGTLRFFGTTKASELAQQMETLARAGDLQPAVELLPEFQAEVSKVVAEVERRVAGLTQ